MPPTPPEKRPGAFGVLLIDCGPSVVGAAVIYPAAFIALCRWLVGRAAESGGAPTDGSLPAAIAAGSLGVLTVLTPFLLTGPRALICRMLVFAVLAGAVLLGYFLETMISGAFSWGFTTFRDEATGVPRPGAFCLTAISVGYMLVLFALTRVVMVFSGGRAAQFGLAALAGAAMIGSSSFIGIALRNADSLDGKRAVVAWFFRLNPVVSAYETCEYRGWHEQPNRFYAEGGEEIRNILSSPTGEAGAAGAKPATQPTWRQTSLILFFSGACLWFAAAVVAFVRNRIAARRPA